MKRINIKSCLRLVAFSFVLGISGCISIPTSPTPRFYALSATNKIQVSKKYNIPSGTVIGIGPVKIPEYLNRPQMVTETPEKMLEFAQFDRWGESLDNGVARIIREDLTSLLPQANLAMYPWNPSLLVKYQVAIEVVQMDSELDKDMYFVAQWMIIDVQNSKTVVIKRSEFRKAIIPQNYTGLAKTLSTACASLSSQIAETLINQK